MLLRIQRFIERQYLTRTVEWIVWDFDGTLYRSKELRDKFERAYYDFLSDQASDGVSLERFRDLSKTHHSWSMAVSVLTGIPEIAVITKVERRFDKTKHIPKNAQVVHFLSSLSRFRHVIFSNSTNDQILKGLRRIGFPRISKRHFPPFEAIFDRERTQALKPDEKILRSIQEFTQAPKRTHLVVGDSLHHDIIPARRYGFRAKHIDEFLGLFGV